MGGPILTVEGEARTLIRGRGMDTTVAPALSRASDTRTATLAADAHSPTGRLWRHLPRRRRVRRRRSDHAHHGQLRHRGRNLCHNARAARRTRQQVRERDDEATQQGDGVVKRAMQGFWKPVSWRAPLAAALIL